MKDNENYKVITVLSHYYLGILEVEERGGGGHTPFWNHGGRLVGKSR